MSPPPVVVGLTTIPSRYDFLRITLGSLALQTHSPDEIRLCLPRVSRRERKPYKLPPWLGEFPRVRVVWTEIDYGPLCKLYGPLGPGDLPAQTLIVTVDDDTIYDATLIARLVQRVLEWPEAAIGFSGWDADRLASGKGSYRFVYEETGDFPDGRPTDILEGSRGAIYRRGMFGSDLFDQEGWPPEMFYVDDVWISGYLARRCIMRRVVKWWGSPPLTQAARLRIWHDQKAPNGLHKQGGVGLFERQNMIAVQALARRYGQIWKPYP